MEFARDMETRLADKFVGMYVNHYTLDAGDIIPKAAKNYSIWASKPDYFQTRASRIRALAHRRSSLLLTPE